MKRALAFLVATALAATSLTAGITVSLTNVPASRAFAEVMRQCNHNFVYSSGLLDGVNVTISAKDEPLDRVLDRMFGSTDIEWRLSGSNVILTRRKAALPVTIGGIVREAGSEESLAGVAVIARGGREGAMTNALGQYSITVPATVDSLTFRCAGYESQRVALKAASADGRLNIELARSAGMLDEVVAWGSANRSLSLDAARIGALNLSGVTIANTPVIFGESDVIKTLQLEPGVSAGVEGMAGMYVHGGNVDENLYMLDNIPLYQVNHFGGLFSAFNVGAIRNVDFYKSTFPARLDGRLSSYMDVRTKDGSMERHNGSFTLGLTSGALDINGPIAKGRTSYSLALRRSWYDLLTIPAFAITNSRSKSTKSNFGYSFTDLNAKITHRLDDKSQLHLMAYYGNDRISYSESHDKEIYNGTFDVINDHMRWGNVVVSAGMNRMFSSKVFGEFTIAYTQFATKLTAASDFGSRSDGITGEMHSDRVTSSNKVADFIAKADFSFHPSRFHSFDFGASFTRHSFLPSRTVRTLKAEGFEASASEQTDRLGANHAELYAGGDWTPTNSLRIDYGAHLSAFAIDSKTHCRVSPRLSARWAPAPGWAIKGGYSRTTQFVHQLLQSSISLPTDQWVPIVGDQKPQTADKISAGVYHTFGSDFTLSVEAYYKWMKNLIDYADEYYLLPPETPWSDKLTSGSGTAKGIDVKLAREFGKLTGHVAYSLMWADRSFANRNGGRTFPARFDNRHKINIVLSWNISDRWQLGATWTGMSGNRFTLPLQCWDDPMLGPWHYDQPLATDVNNYRLPFYHRLDLGLKRFTVRGHWTFALYNAYCNLNTIAVRRDYSDVYFAGDSGHPKFQKIKLIPLIPSVSYTWTF